VKKGRLSALRNSTNHPIPQIKDLQGKPIWWLTIFSLTHILTSEWNSLGLLATFLATILAKAVPNDPDPTMATLCRFDGSGEGGREAWTGEEGRVMSTKKNVMIRRKREEVGIRLLNSARYRSAPLDGPQRFLQGDAQILRLTRSWISEDSALTRRNDVGVDIHTLHLSGRDVGVVGVWKGRELVHYSGEDAQSFFSVESTFEVRGLWLWFMDTVFCVGCDVVLVVRYVKEVEEVVRLIVVKSERVSWHHPRVSWRLAKLCGWIAKRRHNHSLPSRFAETSP
jgi:hypothetical protein